MCVMFWLLCMLWSGYLKLVCPLLHILAIFLWQEHLLDFLSSFPVQSTFLLTAVTEPDSRAPRPLDQLFPSPTPASVSVRQWQAGAGAEGGREEPAPRVHVSCSVWDSSGFGNHMKKQQIKISHLKKQQIKISQDKEKFKEEHRELQATPGLLHMVWIAVLQKAGSKH